MLALLTSPDALMRSGRPDVALAAVLKAGRAAGNPVALVSNHRKPPWFDGLFLGSGVQYLQARGRQGGEIVRENATHLAIQPYDIVVLATKPEDVQMGKNGRALLVAGGWANDRQVASLGIQVANAAELQEILNLTAGWSGQWWFNGHEDRYNVKALSDLSGYGKTLDQQAFAQRLTATVKNGGGRLNALLTLTARSLLIDGTDQVKDLIWGVYPSSSSSNDDSDVLCDFAHRLRTTVSRVRYAQRGIPLFVRHTPSVKRSRAGASVDRTDPSGQITSLHLNPAYRTKLSGRHVIVVDDCTTYGVSFGVAAAFLNKAGAASVTGIALGKFGNALRYYDIAIGTDPFAPVAVGDFRIDRNASWHANTNPVSQTVLNSLLS